MEHLYNPISALVEQESSRAKQLHGEGYASHHEGYGVFSEEVQEVEQELKLLHGTAEHLLRMIHVDDTEGVSACLKVIKRYAINCACEATQVAAVCQKWLDVNAKEEQKKGEKEDANPCES